MIGAGSTSTNHDPFSRGGTDTDPYGEQNLQQVSYLPVLTWEISITKLASSFVEPGYFLDFHKTCCKFCWPPGFNKTCTCPTSSLENKFILVPTPAAL